MTELLFKRRTYMSTARTPSVIASPAYPVNPNLRVYLYGFVARPQLSRSCRRTVVLAPTKVVGSQSLRSTQTASVNSAGKIGFALNPSSSRKVIRRTKKDTLRRCCPTGTKCRRTETTASVCPLYRLRTGLTRVGIDALQSRPFADRCQTVDPKTRPSIRCLWRIL